MWNTRAEPTPSELVVLGAAIALIGTALSLVLTPSSTAQEQVPTEAAAVLEKMAGAEHATYQVRQLVVYFGAPQSAAVLDVRSSPSGHFVRAESGGEVTRFWRRADVGIVSDEHGSIRDAAPPAVPLRPGAVLAKYDIVLEDRLDIFGVNVVPLVLVRRSDRATVERLWVEPTSGIVYRRELYGAGGRLVGMSTVLDMHWGAQVADDPVEPSALRPARVEAFPGTDAPAMLSHGYRLLGTYRIQSVGSSSPAEHWVYTDGLHALSIFRTSGRLKAPGGFEATDLDGARAWIGPGPGTWAWEGGGASWVIVAEEPALDPTLLTARLPKGGPSVWARLGSVWSRVFRGIAALFS
jgi:negative regulator of sigma E activity